MSLGAEKDHGFLEFLKNNWGESFINPGKVDNRAFQGRYTSVYKLLEDPTANAFYHKVYSLFYSLPEKVGRRVTRGRALEAKKVNSKKAGHFTKVRLFLTKGDRKQGRLRKRFLDVAVNHETGSVLPTPETREAIFQFGSLVLIAMRPGMKGKPTKHVLFRTPGAKKESDLFYLSDHSAQQLSQAMLVTPICEPSTQGLSGKRLKHGSARVHKKRRKLQPKDAQGFGGLNETRQACPRSTGSNREKMLKDPLESRMQALLLAAGISS